MKIFISQGLRGRQNPEAYRAKCLEAVKRKYPDAEIIDSFFKDFNGNRIAFLGRSISEKLSQADVAVFMDNWRNYDGCVIEHEVALRYGITVDEICTGEDEGRISVNDLARVIHESARDAVAANKTVAQPQKHRHLRPGKPIGAGMYFGFVD